MKRVIATDFHKGSGLRPGLKNTSEIIKGVYGGINNLVEYWVELGKIKHAYYEAKSPAQKWDSIRRYYEFVRPLIESETPDRWAVMDNIPDEADFTPIEQNAWGHLRYHRVVMYPQYPILNYFVDFANPRLKLIVELDGKEYHSSQEQRVKDAARDHELIAQGWDVYRILGAECYRDRQRPRLKKVFYDDGEDCYVDAMREWFWKTSDGFIYALSMHYFRGYSKDHPEAEFIEDTIRIHRSH